MTEKQIKAQQAQKKSKRNTIIYSVVGGVCAVAVAALLIWNSGFFQQRVPALTIGGKNYTSVDVQYYYSQAANQWYSYAQYGYVTNLDPEQPPQGQMYDEEQTWHEMFLESAISTVGQYKAICQDAKKNGFDLSDEDKQLITEEIDSMKTQIYAAGYPDFDTYLKTAYGSRMTEKKFVELYSEEKLASQYAQAYADKLTYTDADLDKYYADNEESLKLYRYGSALFSGIPETKKDAEGMTIAATDEEKAAAVAAAKKKAEEFKAALESGKSFDEASKVYEGDSKVTVNMELAYAGGSIGTLFKDWVTDPSRKQGDVTLIENGAKDGFYVLRFDSSGRDTEISGDIRHILIQADMDGGATQPTEEQYAAAKKKAEDMLAQWKQNGGTEEAFAELAKKESADPGSRDNGGLYEQVTTTKNYITEFANWAVDPARKTGDTAIIKNDGSQVKGYHIMYYVGQNDPLWKIDARTALINSDTSAWITGLVEKANITRGDGLQYVG